MKSIITLLITLIFFSFSYSQISLSNKEKKSITKFVKKEVKLLKKLKMKKYYSHFDKSKFHPIFKEESFNMDKQIEKSKSWKKSKDKKFRLIRKTSFKQFYNDFTLHIYTKQQLEESYSKTALALISKKNILKAINPKVNFTDEQYLIFLCPKFKEGETPKYGDFFVLQIIEKQGKDWKVIASIF